MTQRVGRNDPCPCGSGRKYKNCHGRNQTLLGGPIGRPMWAMVVLIAAGAAVVAALGVRFWPRKATAPERFAPLQSGAVTDSGPEPAPYTYDPQGNRHWDPAHRHWHPGPPPTGASAAPPPPPAGPEPSPWTYDERSGQHWDPTHRHWHQGPPPPPEARVTPPRADTIPRTP